MEETEGASSVTRPKPRRLAPQSPGAESTTPGFPTFSTVPSETLSNPNKHQRKSAWATWARHEGSGAAHSPVVNKGIQPPKLNDAILATQAAAHRMWERATESDATDCFTPPPGSPPVVDRSSPQATAAAPVWPPQLSGQFNTQEAYLVSLKAALSSQTSSSAAAAFAEGLNARKTAGQPHTIQSSHSGIEGAIPDRPDPANGSLSILPEQQSHTGASSNPGLHPTGLRGHPGASGLAHIARLSQQLEELLRGQSLSQSSAQLPILASEPPMYGSGASMPLVMPTASHPPFARFGSQDHLREAFWGGAPDLDSLRSDVSAACTERRWNSIGSLASENSLLPPANSLGPQQLVAQLFPNLSAIDSQTLLHSIRLLSQANEMAALANSRIQACSLAANANLEGLAATGLRKRKMPDYYCDAPVKRHSSALSEADTYSHSHASHIPQMCAECGTTNTPTWRRSGKKLMCNACGLRRSRSMRSARSNSVPGHSAPHMHDMSEMPERAS